jgi:hypothetical protein
LKLPRLAHTTHAKTLTFLHYKGPVPRQGQSRCNHSVKLDFACILRLDEAQSVSIPHLNAKQFCLADDVAEILRQQIDFMLTGAGPSDYTELRETLLND